MIESKVAFYPGFGGLVGGDGRFHCLNEYVIWICGEIEQDPVSIIRICTFLGVEYMVHLK